MREKYEQFLSKNSKMQSVEAYAKHKLSVSIKRHRVPLTCAEKRIWKKGGSNRMKKCGLSSYFFLSPVADYFFMGDFWATCLAALHINSIISINVWWWLFSETRCIFCSEMEGPNFYELEPPAPAAAANGEMAIFVHTHTSFTYKEGILL